MKITMQKIAERAGVSRATVDKVIHGRPGVSDATREKIRNLIDETNYTPVQLRKSAPDLKKPVKIAVIMPELLEDYMRKLKHGMDDTGREYAPYGLQIEYYFCSLYDPQPLIAILEYLKSDHVDGIALRGIDNVRIVELVNEISAIGIPVFTFDADLNCPGRVSYIGEDLYRTGQIGASMLCRFIGSSGEIAVMIGSRTVDSSVKRLQGFQDYIDKYAPDVHIAAVEETLTQRTITYKKTVGLIRNFPGIKGIWNAVGNSEDIARAVTDNDKKNQIIIGAVTFSRDVIKLIKEHEIDFSIGLDPYNMGRIVISSIYEYIVSGITPPSEIINPNVSIGIDANIDLFEQGYSWTF